MIKKNKKGFTIVELVIVIAIVAVLAAVLIPTFSSLIDKANQSADIQAVRQMNMALATESVIVKPTDVEDVIKILAAAGFNAQDKLVPVTAKHGFYWCEPANMITLIKDEGNGTPTLIFPVDNETINNAFNTAKNNWAAENKGFFDLEPNSEGILPPTIDGGVPGGNGGSGGSGTPETPPSVTGVTLNPTDVTVCVGDTVTLVAKVTPDNATDKTVTWESGNSDFAAVEGGVVTAKAAGTATITVTTKDGSKTATCTVSVVDPADFTPVTNAEELKTALAEGKNCKLTGNIALNSAITVTGASTIDLAGCTLTLVDPSTGSASYDVLTVSGNLTIVDSDGNGKIIIQKPENPTADSDYCGIRVNNGGKLNITGIDIEGNRKWNIRNDGTISLTNTDFTVNDGIGLDNNGTATIANGVLTEIGQVLAIRGTSGEMTIAGTTFNAGTDSSSYMASIDISGGTTTLNNITVTEGKFYSVYAVSSGNVIINGGTFNSPVAAGDTSASLTIQSGTFNKGIAWTSDSTLKISGGAFDGTVSCNGGTTEISGGTFNGDLECVNTTTVNITNGTFNGTVKAIAENSNRRPKINISGGTFKKQLILGGDDIANNAMSTITIKGGTFNDGTTSVSYDKIAETATIFVNKNKTTRYALTYNETNNCWVISAAS